MVTFFEIVEERTRDEIVEEMELAFSPENGRQYVAYFPDEPIPYHVFAAIERLWTNPDPNQQLMLATSSCSGQS